MTCAVHAALALHWPRVETAIARGQWSNFAVELVPTNDLVRFIHAYPIVGGRTMWHCFRLEFSAYPAQPPSLQCVHPLTKELAHKGYTRWWPRSTSPSINLQTNSEPPYFCFPYTLEWATTHQALDESHPHRWRSAGTNPHTVSATLTELRRIFRPAFYQGYFDATFEETLHEELVKHPSRFSPWADASA